MNMELTTRQSEIFSYLYDYFLGNDALPPMGVTAERFGFTSDSASEYHMKTLKRKGFLQHNAHNKYMFTPKGRNYIEFTQAIESLTPGSQVA
jgi:SOS-response transcriptional repressor LexA